MCTNTITRLQVSERKKLPQNLPKLFCAASTAAAPSTQPASPYLGRSKKQIASVALPDFTCYWTQIV